MSDSSESTTSLDWAIVDQQGSIPDDDVTSTASSVEVVDEDDDDSYDCHNTPLAGSPQINMPKFVLRLHSQDAVNVSDTDEEQCDISSLAMKSETSIASIPESIPSCTELGTSKLSENTTAAAGHTYRQSSSPARISQEDLEDLCSKIDAVKKALEPVKKLEDVEPDEMFGDGKADTSSQSTETIKNTPRQVEEVKSKECYDGDISMQSSVSSSYSFLSRDIGTDSRSNSELPEDVGNNDQQPLLVEQLLEHQEPVIEQLGGQEPVRSENVAQEPIMEDQRMEAENLNDLLQVEQGPNYLQRVVSHFVDYRDIIAWIVGFGSYTGLVVATVVFLSGPSNMPVVSKDSLPSSDISTLHQHCHGEECSTEGFLLNNPKIMLSKLKDCDRRVKELEDSMKAKDDDINMFKIDADQMKGKINALKNRKNELKNELRSIQEEKEEMKENYDRAVEEWKLKWQNGLNDVEKMKKDRLDLEEKHVELKQEFDRCNEEKIVSQGKKSDSCHQARHELDSERNRCSHDINNLQVKCRNDLDNAKHECQVLTDNLQAHHQSNLDNAKSQYRFEMDKLEYKHIHEMQRLRHESQLDVEKIKKSCNMFDDDNNHEHSNNFENKDRYSTNDEKTKYYEENNNVGNDDVIDDDDNDDDDQDTNDRSGTSELPNYNIKWADTIVEMMNTTRNEIENTWAKVKNMSESMWTEHEPTIRNLHQSFTKKMMKLNDKFQEKVSRKLNKWFGRKEQAPANTKRRKHKTDTQDVTHITLEQRLVKLSYVVDAFTAKSFMRTYKKKMSDLERIQAEFKDIDASRKIPHTPAEWIKWKDYILTDQHLKWLRCHQVFWEDFNKVTDTCYKELCCWEVKVAHGDVKACKKFKRQHGMVEDRCYLELPKDNVDTEEDTIESDDNDDVEENWYFERVEDRDYQRTEPDDWFFRRKHKDGSEAPGDTHYVNDQYDDDDNDDDGYVYDGDDDYIIENSNRGNCYPDRCDRP
ncbi:hypothetical protein ACF0H5_013497 [Mactra antiquata]